MLLLLRLIGMAVAGIAGWQLGVVLAGFPNGTPQAGEALRYVLVLALAGAALGLLLTPYATVVPLRWMWRMARGVAAADLFGATAGLLVGLLIAALASFPISLLPDPFGRWLPATVAIVFGWLGVALGALRKEELLKAAGGLWAPASGRSEAGPGGWRNATALLLDTSAIIDGRIVEIALCGFLPGTLTVPRFVLEELQLIADSADMARRQRGRRGLEMLERLKRDLELVVLDIDFPEVRGVDSKLVRLARQQSAALVTTDFNLNRVASLQSVTVLNINELASALRSVVIPGEDLSIDVIQEGRERGQGVGYLDDGTMVVIEGGRRLVGGRAEVEVTRILPTVGGRMVFARPRAGGEAATPHDDGAPGNRLRVVREPLVPDGD